MTAEARMASGCWLTSWTPACSRQSRYSAGV